MWIGRRAERLGNLETDRDAATRESQDYELSGGGPMSRHSPPGSGSVIPGCAVGGASAARNRRFESVPLQQPSPTRT